MIRRIPAGAYALVLAAALVGLIVLSITVGSVRILSGDVWAIVAHRLTGSPEPWWTPARASIVWDSRLPRALTAALVGAALAMAGAAAQVVTRNPLADPYLLGVSSGAGFGVVAVTILGWGSGAGSQITIPVAAFLGGLAPLAISLLLGGAMRSTTAMILIGIAVGQVFSAFITFTLLVVAKDQQLAGVMHWMAGGFGDARWSHLGVPAVLLVVVAAALLLGGRRLDLLHAGEDGARALGMNVTGFRVAILLAVSLLAGVSVALAGGIGFVGLLVPHLARLLVGVSARRLLPIAALSGAVVMVAADTAARSVTTRLEVPVGVVTALVGAPILVVMLWREQRGLR